VSYVERQTRSGLILAEKGADSVAIERELRKRDPLLSLQGVLVPEWNRIRWRVVRDAGSEQEPETLCIWQAEEGGEPYPLSSALLDLVDRLDRNTRFHYAGEDELERQRQVSRDRQVERDNEALRDDWNPRHGRPVLPRSQSLRMARDKRRAKGEKC
jgi:hypothetical protein